MKKMLMVGMVLCAALAQADKLAVWDLDHISKAAGDKLDEQEAGKKIEGMKVALLEHSNRSKTSGGPAWKGNYGAIGFNEENLEDAIDSDNCFEISFSADGEMDLTDLRLSFSFDMGNPNPANEITVAVFSSLTEEMIAGQELASKSKSNGPGNDKMEMKVPLTAPEFQGVSEITFYIYAYSSGDAPLGQYTKVGIGNSGKQDGENDIVLNGVLK